jgi:hypothetical protein
MFPFSKGKEAADAPDSNITATDQSTMSPQQENAARFVDRGAQLLAEVESIKARIDQCWETYRSQREQAGLISQNRGVLKLQGRDPEREIATLLRSANMAQDTIPGLRSAIAVAVGRYGKFLIGEASQACLSICNDVLIQPLERACAQITSSDARSFPPEALQLIFEARSYASSLESLRSYLRETTLTAGLVDSVGLADRMDSVTKRIDSFNKLVDDCGVAASYKVQSNNLWSRLFEVLRRTLEKANRVIDADAIAAAKARQHAAQQEQLRDIGKQLGAPDPVEHAVPGGGFISSAQAVNTRF